MYDFKSVDFWIIAGIGMAVGLLIGWVASSLTQKKQAGGKSANQLREEMESYREQVNDHFARTAELFKDTTEKYRDLYEHLASGAEGLATDLPDRTEVEFRPGKLLADQSNDEAPAESEVLEPAEDLAATRPV